MSVSGVYYSVVCLPPFLYRVSVDEVVWNRFMPADALWTFAMAFNVYLTFFHKHDAAKLRHLEWKYIVLCYGLPFIPPFAYLFIHSSSKGPVYGSATVSLPLSPSFTNHELMGRA